METFNRENISAETMSHIKGWGIDADPKNDPTYPMKQRTDAEHQGYNWERPAQQSIDDEVLHSIERPNVTAVYGTSAPPSGVSGMIRRLAFRFSEGSFGHWLPLLLADRVNTIEGIVDDLTHGNVPNVCAEKGIKAQWQYDQKNLAKKWIFRAAVTATIVTLVISRRRK